MTRVAIAFVAVMFGVTASGQPGHSQLQAVFTQVGLSSDQVSAIGQGRPVAKVLPWGEASEIYVFGAVYIEGSPSSYLAAARDVNAFSKSESYRGAGEIPASATVADLKGLSLDADDVEALKNCKEGDCDVQLPTAAIQDFRNSVNWSQPDVANQVNALARARVLQLVNEYRHGGNAALGVYRDKKKPALVADQFSTLVSRSAELPDVLPELRQYLLNYPAADLPNAESFFYWEKVSFGLKPTIRVNHGVTYHAEREGHELSVVAIKQLYASHYFHTALDVSVCASAKPERQGFYLLTLKGSEQEGLTGFKGSMVRKVVVDKTRSSLEGALASIKQSVERAAVARED
jgi:hypothetical protein